MMINSNNKFQPLAEDKRKRPPNLFTKIKQDPYNFEINN